MNYQLIITSIFTSNLSIIKQLSSSSTLQLNSFVQKTSTLNILKLKEKNYSYSN